MPVSTVNCLRGGHKVVSELHVIVGLYYLGGGERKCPCQKEKGSFSQPMVDEKAANGKRPRLHSHEQSEPSTLS
jgi:hypothetical protein